MMMDSRIQGQTRTAEATSAPNQAGTNQAATNQAGPASAQRASGNAQLDFSGPMRHPVWQEDNNQ